jgi:hypothetical protein
LPVQQMVVRFVQEKQVCFLINVQPLVNVWSFAGRSAVELHFYGQQRGQILVRLLVGFQQSGGGEQDVDALELSRFELEIQSS